MEAGKKGAFIRKLKKEQREKDQQIQTVTYQKEKPLNTKSEKPMTYTRVEKHGNIFNYAIIGLAIIGVTCFAYSKYQENKIVKSQDHLCCLKKDEKTEENVSSKYNILDMK